MNTWAILGDIEFGLKNNPSAFSQSSSSDWAEHSLIRDKPKLEFMGEALDEITLEVLFHAHLVNPETQIKKLQEARNKHEPLSLVMGSGDYRGHWVIVDMDIVANKTTANGTLRSVTVSLTLKEFAGEFEPQSPKLGLLDNINLPIDSLNKLSELTNAVQQVTTYARTGMNILTSGIALLDALKDNPLSAIGQLGGLSNTIGQAVPALSQFTEAAKYLKDSQRMVNAGLDAVNYVKNASSLLTDAALNGDLSRVYAAANSAKQALGSMNSVNGDLLSLSTKIATRIGQ